MAYLELGKATLVEDVLRQLTGGVGAVYENRIAMIRLLNSAMVGSFDPASFPSVDLAQISSMDRAFKYQAVAVAQQVAGLMSERAGRPASNNPAGHEPAWVLSTRALLGHDEHGALYQARQHQRLGAGTMIGFDAYTLIRAELACRHGEAALSLLQARNERGTVHYFDDLFLARAQLLLGNRDKTAEHLRVCTRPYRPTAPKGGWNSNCSLRLNCPPSISSSSAKAWAAQARSARRAQCWQRREKGCLVAAIG
jgi:hypothetical protein